MNCNHVTLASIFLTLTVLVQAQSPQQTASNILELFDEDSIFFNEEAVMKARMIRDRLLNQGGCNANICFALTSDGSVFPQEFQTMKEFVQFTASIISGTGNNSFAAVQYGLRSTLLSELTSGEIQFLLDVENAVQTFPSRIFVASGIGACTLLLRPRVEESNKIVLIIDDRSNHAGNPVPLARRFREMYGDICAVGIGFEGIRKLRRIAGRRRRAFSIDEYDELLEIVYPVISEICDLK